MLMLTGDTRATRLVELLRVNGWGRIWIDRTPTPYEGEPWGFDNGAFRDWRNALQFDTDAYQRRLERAYAVGAPYMAIVPDLVAQGGRSLEFSMRWLEKLPQDWPWFLAVQDGMGLREVESVVEKFTGLFLGGTNSFKATAFYWSELAHQHVKFFHYGRAGVRRKLYHAMEVGSDSADSAFPLWTGNRLDDVQEALISGMPRMLFQVESMALHPDVFR